MPIVRIPANGWRPRPYQMPAWVAWERGIKRSSLWWHRRAGKDELSLHKAAVAMHPSAKTPMSNARVANYWHCLPEYAQARKAIWTAINPHSGKLRIDEAFPHELRESTRNDDMSITFKSGAAWRLVGSDNPDSLVGTPPFGIVFSEWALSNPSVWGYLQPILRENGGWADFITTPRGKNHAYSLHKAARGNPAWFCETLTVADTNALTQADLEEVRKEYAALYGDEAAEALIEQEYFCSADAAILGAYYGKEMARADREGRITAVGPDPRYDLHTAWDLGIRDSMVVLFFQILPAMRTASRVLVLACYSASGYGIGHYADVIKEFRERTGCLNGTDYVPFDAKQREMGVFDVPDENTPHEERYLAKQRLEVMIECGLRPKVIAQHMLADGISAVRQVLPRCWIDEAACETWIEGMRQYQTEWDDETKTFRDKPKHDWSSHYADAGRTMAMAYRQVQAADPKPHDRALVVGGLPAQGYGLPTYNDLARLQAEEPKVRERI